MLTAQEYFEQAHMSAHDWMNRAVAAIDEKFGDGFARAHPELVGAYMQTCALDFMASFSTSELSGALERIADALDE